MGPNAPTIDRKARIAGRQVRAVVCLANHVACPAATRRCPLAHVHWAAAGVEREITLINIPLGETMNRVSRNTLATFQSVQEFITQHPLADAPALLGAQAQELGAVIEGLTASAVDQEAGMRFQRVHVQSQRTLREALYMQHMRPISLVAREVFGVTGTDRAFRLPKTRRVSQTVLNAARAMAQAAENNRGVFVLHGLADDFVDQLRSAIDALTQARTSKTSNLRRLVTATASTDGLVKRGRKAVRLLDAILVPRFAQEPELLAAWRTAKKVRPATAQSTTEAPAAPSDTEKAA